MLAAGSRNSRSETQFGSMLMKTQPPQVSTLTSASDVRASFSAPFQSCWIEDVHVLAVQVERPAMEAADEPLLRAARAVRTGRCADEPTAAMRAHVVIGLELIGCRADDEDRVIADLVGQVTADVRDLLDAPGHLPHLRPQLVGLGLGILRGQ